MCAHGALHVKWHGWKHKTLTYGEEAQAAMEPFDRSPKATHIHTPRPVYIPRTHAI